MVTESEIAALIKENFLENILDSIRKGKIKYCISKYTVFHIYENMLYMAGRHRMY